MNIIHFLRLIRFELASCFAEAYINSKFNSFWDYKRHIINKLYPPHAINSVDAKDTNRKDVMINTPMLYNAYQRKFGASIGIMSEIASPPITPHGLNGIHISEQARIGKNCVIFQQVTIGSNTIPNHPRYGSPSIGDNVFIGAGAKIIGNINIGNNCRIGANCVVVSDMPANTTAVCASTRFISHSDMQIDNSFSGIIKTS